jgi:hypothetical protein
MVIYLFQSDGYCSFQTTNFRPILHFCPLTSKLAAEVGFQLLDIFLLFGAPHILQSDNGCEFTANIIKELKDMWLIPE